MKGGEEGQGVNEIMGIKKEHKSGDIIIILTQIYVGEQRGEVWDPRNETTLRKTIWKGLTTGSEALPHQTIPCWRAYP